MSVNNSRAELLVLRTKLVMDGLASIWATIGGCNLMLWLAALDKLLKFALFSKWQYASVGDVLLAFGCFTLEFVVP